MLVAGFALLSLVATATSAFAQSAASKAAAETLFDEARELLKKKDYAQACQKFEQSQAIDPGIGTLFYLAQCYELQGRFASAWATFREAASQAKAAGQVDRATRGEARAAELRPKLTKLTVVVPDEVRALEGLTIQRNGKELPASLYNVEFPVDPGDHRLVAEAPGYRPLNLSIPIAKGDKRKVVSIPPLQIDDSEAAAATLEEPKLAPVDEPTEPGVDAGVNSSGDGQRWTGIVVGAGGLVLGGVGVLFGLKAQDKEDQAEEFCGDEGCWDQRGEDLSEEGQTAALIANVSYGLGLAGVATGLILYLTAPDSEASQAGGIPAPFGMTLTPAVDARASGLLLSGGF